MKNVRGNEDIRRIVERICNRLEAIGKRREEKEWRAHVTVSIGVAICRGRGSTAVDALERADRAMYRAKALGRDGRFVIDESPTLPIGQRETEGVLVGHDRLVELD
jgi:diguanylate cyclase (GGDEF)-like protein